MDEENDFHAIHLVLLILAAVIGGFAGFNTALCTAVKDGGFYHKGSHFVVQHVSFEGLLSPKETPKERL